MTFVAERIGGLGMTPQRHTGRGRSQASHFLRRYRGGDSLLAVVASASMLKA